MSTITIQGAREHNLKNISLTLPRNSLIVFTGLSGSGKSSLAFDTIYAEARRRYLESLSLYSRQFLEQLEKPHVDSITGLSPAISIDQSNISRHPRSTVGTTTELYDYMRLLFARLGTPFCNDCNLPILPFSNQQIYERLLKQLEIGDYISILSPVIYGKKGEFTHEIAEWKKKYTKAKLNQEIIDLNSITKLHKSTRHSLSILIDTMKWTGAQQTRLLDSINLALELMPTIEIVHGENLLSPPLLFSTSNTCPQCQIALPPLEPKLFSFNRLEGACPKCFGFGVQSRQMDFETFALITDRLSIPLPSAITQCSLCHGSRLKKEALQVKINDLNIFEVVSLKLEDFELWLTKIQYPEHKEKIARPILKDALARIKFLNKLGLGYLNLNRGADTLSGGEAQRIQLATQLGSPLSGILYVLDEPSIGLHQVDNTRLIETLNELKNQGNTVLVVEHDEEHIRKADYIVDLGPRAGSQGGEIVFHGSPQMILKNKESLTARYLNGTLTIDTPMQRRTPREFISFQGLNKNNLKNIDISFPLGGLVVVTGVSGSGKSTLVFEILYNFFARTPIFFHSKREKKNSVFSISPSMYSSLGITSLTWKQPRPFSTIHLDQSPFGRTPRSNPATYTGIFTEIRKLFASLSESKARGFTLSRFSFNRPGGRCESCKGDGAVKIEMHFMPDVFQTCAICDGKRYNEETRIVEYKGKNISDILSLTLDDASELFKNIPSIYPKIKTLIDVGLGYIQVGQSAVTFSGGEAQRLKLSRELNKRKGDGSLYFLDEPTTGLHFDDVKKLIHILHRLVDKGSTVVVVEHNMDVIKQADYIIDLGPFGGDKGGEVIFQGTPENLIQVAHSPTGKFLKHHLLQAQSQNQTQTQYKSKSKRVQSSETLSNFTQDHKANKDRKKNKGLNKYQA